MNLDEVANVAAPSPASSMIYDRKYADFVEEILKRAASDFEKERKCTLLAIYFPLSPHNFCVSNNLLIARMAKVVLYAEKEICRKIEVKWIRITNNTNNHINPQN